MIGIKVTRSKMANLVQKNATLQQRSNQSSAANVLMCRQWWKVCWVYGDQEKYYRQLYGRNRPLSTLNRNNQNNNNNTNKNDRNRTTFTSESPWKSDIYAQQNSYFHESFIPDSAASLFGVYQNDGVGNTPVPYSGRNNMYKNGNFTGQKQDVLTMVTMLSSAVAASNHGLYNNQNE